MPLKLLIIVSNSSIKSYPAIANPDIDICIDPQLSDKNRMYAAVKKTYAYYLFIDRDIEFLEENALTAIAKTLKENCPAVMRISDDVKIYHRSLIHYFFLTIPYQIFNLSDINFVLSFLEEPFQEYNVIYDGKVWLGNHNIYEEKELLKWESRIPKIEPKSWINRIMKHVNRISSISNGQKRDPLTANFLRLVNIHSYFEMDHPYFKNKKIHFPKTLREIYGDIGTYHFAHDFLNASRNRIINHLIYVGKYRTYAEIGVFNCHHFDEVMIEYKIGVDPKPDFSNKVYQKWRNNIILKTSDDFFNSLANDIKYDIIFIDGCLMEENVSRDIYNALDHLNDGGVVVMHDCNPPHEFYQRDNINGKYKKNKDAKIKWNGKEYIDRYWNGKTWKAIAKIRMTDPDVQVYTVDTDWGMGIIRKGRNTFQMQSGGDIDKIRYDTLVKYRRQLLNLITVEEFLQLFPL